jgi:hypothetical protein
LRFKKDRTVSRSSFRVAACIIQAVGWNAVEAETQRLVQENIHLREALRERYDFSNMVAAAGCARFMSRLHRLPAPTRPLIAASLERARS